MNSQHGKDYIVQPLPVSNFAIHFGKKKNTLELTWKGEDDPLEPTARPREYIVYTRIGYGGFDNGTLVSKPYYSVKSRTRISLFIQSNSRKPGRRKLPF